MFLTHILASALFGSTGKMRRVMTYWAATAVMYGVCCLIVWREYATGHIGRSPALLVCLLCLIGQAVFFVLLRGAPRFGIRNWKLALTQAGFAIVIDLALYAALPHLQGVLLIGMPVVIVFCAFALRPRQTIMLSAFALCALGTTVGVLVWWDPLRHPLYEGAIHFLLTSIGVMSVTAITGELSRLRGQLLQAVTTIRTLATTDELTLLANRRHMRDLLAVEQQRRAACPKHVCVALLDIDFFKAINDQFGHAAGDLVLQSFAREAGATLRAADTLARWGGEEFLLLMPDTRLDEALAVLGRISAHIGTLRVDAVDPQLRVTFSAGVAASLPLERFDEAIQRADEAMYRAKASGRNCVMAA